MGMFREDELQQAESLLAAPDAEDCERFASRYGSSLVAAAREYRELLEAVEGLGALPEGYCFCSSNRIGDDSRTHEPECRDLRAAIAKARGEV